MEYKYDFRKQTKASEIRANGRHREHRSVIFVTARQMRLD
jgi:hypothetical protein